MDKIKLIKNLMFLKAGIWTVFAGIHFGRGTETSQLLAILMLIDAVIFSLIGWKIDKCKLLYYFAVAFLAVNILLTIVDQLGFFDYVILFIDSFILGLLVFSRKEFTKK